MNNPAPTAPADRLGEAIASYYEMIEEGLPFDRTAFLERYPELTTDLSAFLDRVEAIENIAHPTPPHDDTSPNESPSPSDRAPTTLGEYELLEELGRGGMGVVYKARQRGLNRLVALKVILAGEFASKADVNRFYREAEAVAGLDHPRIVPIYEIGSHHGRHFFSMKFIDGATLASRRGDYLNQPRATATLVGEIALAVYHAHQHGILHRDLKPGNILLDSERNPHVVDFGLARPLGGGSDLTRSGAAVGTPSYMAPEQASGGGRQVSTAADVYGLGAILYELLTGVPPFRADSPYQTVQLLLQTEPAAPRRVNPQVPADLETICLKAMAKEPTRRYASAAELTADLRRWLNHEPIQARPVGRVERAVKWVKRNGVVAGALAAASVALLVGSGVSLGFGLEATKQEQAAREQAGRADYEADQARISAADARRERNDAVVARNDLARTNDDLTDALARALLGPMVPDRFQASLTPYETEACWQLASRRGTLVNRRFLEEATRSLLTAKQLAHRAEFAFQAAIGLDPVIRDQTERLLADRISAPETSAEYRTELARAARWLGPLSPETAEQVARALVEAMTRTVVPSTRRELAVVLAAVAGHMKPEIAADVCGTAARLMSEARRLPLSDRDVIEGLVALADHMKPDEAARVLVEAYGNHLFDDKELAELSASLSMVTGRMKPAEASDLLLGAMARNAAWPARRDLAMIVASVAARVDRHSAANACDRAAQLLVETMTKDRARARRVETVLSAVTSHMEPGRAADVRDKAARLLLDAMANQLGRTDRDSLAMTLASVADQMEPAKAAEVCDKAARILTDALTRDPAPHRRHYSAMALAAVARGMETGKAADTCDTAAHVLLDAMAKTTNPIHLHELAPGLASVAGSMEPHKAADVCEKAVPLILQAIANAPSPVPLRGLAADLSALADHLEPDKAAHLLIGAMDRNANHLYLHRLALGLSVTARRMERGKAADVCDKAAIILIGLMETDPGRFPEREWGLAVSVLAGHMEPGRAASACDQAARIITDAMAKNRDSFALLELAIGLSAVARRMEPAQAASACEKAAHLLLDAMTGKPVTVLTLRDLAVELASVARWMERAKAADVCEKAARILTDESFMGASRIDRGLAAVTGLMDAEKAARILMEVRAARAGDPIDQRLVAQRLSVVVLGLSTVDVERRTHAALLAASTLATPGGRFSSLPLFHPHLQPRPRSLPPQTLVDLLKHPFCVAEARRSVLDALAYTYNRPFADQWEFVRFVRENNILLDLITPPNRPQSQP